MGCCAKPWFPRSGFLLLVLSGLDTPGCATLEPMGDPATFEDLRLEETTFRFVAVDYEERSGEVAFTYAFDESITLVERLSFPVPDSPLPPERRRALQRALFLLSLVAGISYYKAAVPPVARIESGTVTEDEIAFLERLYFEGLGEFAYVNGLRLQNRPRFEYTLARERNIERVDLDRRSLVAVGGGKDSCVSVETLRSGNEPMLLASVNGARPILDVVGASGLDFVQVRRMISPELLHLNTIGALNGHVPITAIVSLVLSATALITGCDAVVMSNERSASSGNLDWEGRMVNHQYSKSLDAERGLAELIRNSVTPDLAYFSLLRPLSELEIARRFAQMDHYHFSFTSCNRPFGISPAKESSSNNWCCDCPKCRFVFLALAPFLPPQKLQSIFGFNMLDDRRQEGGFDALIGWNAHKPFECVGEVEESLAALTLLSQRPEWQGHWIVKRFQNDIFPRLTLPHDLTTKPFQPSRDHDVPQHFFELLNATS